MTAIDPALARDIAAMERELLLDPGPQALGVYADMLEDAGLWREAGWLRGLDGCAADEIEGVAAAVRENGYAVGSDFTRRALACLLDATHPVESAELRLSIASGEWPWRAAVSHRRAHRRLGQSDRRGAFWVIMGERLLADWSWDGDGWSAVGRHGNEDERQTPGRRDDAVRAAAREWVARILDKETT